jgi:hypothetical protein
MVSLASVPRTQTALVVARRSGAHIASRFVGSAGWNAKCGRYVPGRRVVVLEGQAGVDFAVADPSVMCPDCAALAMSTAAALPTRERAPRLAVEYDLLPYWLRWPS